MNFDICQGTTVLRHSAAVFWDDDFEDYPQPLCPGRRFDTLAGHITGGIWGPTE